MDSSVIDHFSSTFGSPNAESTAIDYEQQELDQWIGDYINETSSIKDFDTFFMLNNQEWVRVERASKFSQRNDFDDLDDEHFWNQEWVKTQGFLRLCQSVINLLDQTRVDPLKYQQLFEQFYLKSTIPISDILPKLMDLIEPVWNCSWNIFKNNNLKHRNVCLVLTLVLDCCGDQTKVIDHTTRDQILDYLIRIIEECDSNETVLYAVIGIEKIFIRQNLSNEDLRKRLITGLYKLSNNLNQCPTLNISSHHFDPYHYQVGFCSNWFLNQLLLTPTPLTLIPPVKLSPDRFSARSDTSKLLTVRSIFPVISGIYYYEVVLLTGGPMRIGWSIKETQLKEYSILGDHKWSVAFDGYNQCFWSGATSVGLDSPQHWKAGDVVGCVIDCDKHRFAFYLNGRLIKLNSKSIPFSKREYYSSVVLYPYQQVYLNFGQSNFKFPPSENYAQFQVFSSASSSQLRYRLVESTFAGITHSEKEFVHFDDYNQEHFNRIISNLNKLNGKWTNLDDDQMLKSDCAILRLCQFVINANSDTNPSDHYNHYFDLFSTFLSRLETSKSAIIIDLLRMFDPIMNPYLDLYASDWAKHRQVCLIWLIFMEQCPDLINEDISNELINYLIRVIDKCDSDYEMILYALLDVEMLILKVKNFDKFKEDTRKRLIDLCCRLATNNDYPCQDVNHLNYCSYQVGFCSRWLLEHVLLLPKSFIPSVKLSADRLSTRFDGCTSGKTIRSSFSVQSGVYYYEMILLTSGPIRLGWWCSTGGDLAGELLDKNSICFDGHLQRVWHNGKSINLNEMKWKCGDVVGCALDLLNRKAFFYLNGKQINYQVNIEHTFSPYFASAVLSTHQHCIFNFGQIPFRFAPTDLQFNSFHQEANKDILKHQITKQHELENVSDESVDKRFNVFLEELKIKVADNHYDRKYFQLLPKRFECLINSIDHGVYHLFQSILYPSGSIMSDKLDVLIGWIEQYAIASVDRLSYLELFWMTISRMEKYLHLRPHDFAISKQQRNLCMSVYLICKILIDNTLIANDNINLLYFCSKVESFVLRIFMENPHDLWAQYFSVHILTLLGSHDENIKIIIMNNENLVIKLTRLAKYANDCSLSCLYEDNFDSLRYQIGYCANFLLQQFCDNSSLLDSPSSIEPYQLTARCTGDYQNFLSTFSVPKTGVYFYEVILLSSGPMRIGWATKESELSLFNDVGDDRDSIGLDLHQRLIWHNSKCYRIKKETPTWKAGDVIGCLISVADRKFQFFLNGVQVIHKWKLFRKFNFSTSCPYAIAISLTAHQQCCFNLSGTEEPFRFPPKGIAYQTCLSNSNKVNTKMFSPFLCEQCNQLPPTDQCVQCEATKFCIKCSSQSRQLFCANCQKYPFLNGSIN